METLNEVINLLERVEDNPAILLSDPENSLRENRLKLMKNCFQLLSRSENIIIAKDNNKNSLSELFIDGFDDEQIWQQIELKNTNIFSYLPIITEFLLSKDELVFPISKPTDDSSANNENEKDNPSNDISNGPDGDEEEDSSDAESSNDEDEAFDELSLPSSVQNSNSEKRFKKEHKSSKRKVKSVVDDKFFNLEEMEKFLEKAEEEQDMPLDDNIDYFADIPSDPEAEEKELKYDDFFRNPESDNEEMEEDYNKNQHENESSGDENIEDDLSDYSKVKRKKVRFSLNDNENSDSDSGSSNEDHDKDNKRKTAFEEREAKLRQKIERLEEANLSEKPWAYKGEVYSSGRPVNSLLEEVLDVDLTLRPPPVITENVTHSLEDIIINRIKDSAYDDVERKIKPVHVPHELKKELVLNQEKSKYSLAEIYEKEYLKQKPSTETNEEKDKLTPEKTKILRAMKALFHKLDTLSNFHYTPKPISADIEIVSNLPAISMEEVTPAAVSEASLLAPQEVGDVGKKKLLGKDERTKSDKRRERRKKKKFLSQKFSRVKKNEKPTLAKSLKSRNVNLVVPTSDSSINTSAKFFKKLQEDSEVVKKVKKK